MEEIRTCTKCNLPYELQSGFHKQKNRPSGFKTICKKCESEYTKNARKNDPEKFKRWQQKWRKNNVLKSIVGNVA
jgi:hypothetical protein